MICMICPSSVYMDFLTAVYLTDIMLLCILRVRHVYGYEVVPQAIADACQNAKLNGISNATFVQGDLNKIGENFGKDFPKPDVVISGCLLAALLDRTWCCLRKMFMSC